MKKEPLISVVIPVYNASGYIYETWNSLKDQTYRNLEVIFVDDCSKDNSYEILQKIAEEDSRVVVLQNPANSGVSYTRNRGVERATGEYLGFCDADDRCDLDMYESMLNKIFLKNADICCTGLEMMTYDDQVYTQQFQCDDPDWEVSGEDAIRYWLIGKYIGNSVYTKLFKRSLWECIKFPEGEIFEEAFVMPHLFFKAGKVVHNNKLSYKYCMRQDSITHQGINKAKLAVYDRERYLQKLLKGRGMDEELTCFILRENIDFYRRALRSYDSVDPRMMAVIEKEFYKYWRKALLNKYLSPADKVKAILCRTKYFKNKEFKRRK